MATTAGKTSGERDEILRRIQAALAVKPNPEAMHAHPEAKRSDFAAYLPPVGKSADERFAVFAARCEMLRTILVTVAEPSEFVGALREIVADEPGAIAYHAHPLVTPVVGEMGRPLVQTVMGYTPADLERCTFGVTSCTALIAQTGSIVIASDADGGRALSIIAHHHVVLATIGQLIADLPTAYATIDPAQASLVSIISGPSRTGDIERILVLGAHGPRKLTVILALADE